MVPVRMMIAAKRIRFMFFNLGLWIIITSESVGKVQLCELKE